MPILALLIDALALLIDALVDGALISACFTAAMAALSGICIIGALYLCLKAIKDIVRAICGVPDPVVRREFIDANGRRGIEEIPYQPTMNILNVTAQTVRAIQDGRSQH